MTAYPKISIVTVVYNGAEFLERTFNSILCQNYPNLEYIVIDGGSTDGSVDIIKKYEKNFAYWISEKDKGMYDALNKGFSHATGDIVGWINSDDEHYDYSLSHIAKIFTDLPQVNWITGAMTTINEESIIREVCLSNRFLRYSFRAGDFRYIQQESTFWRRSLFEKLDGEPFDLKYKYAGDCILWFKFFLHDDLYYVDIPLGKFRIRSNQLSQSNIEAYVSEIEDCVKSYVPQSKNEAKAIKKYASLRKRLKFLYKFKIIDIERIKKRIYKKELLAVNIVYDDKTGKFILEKDR